MLRWARGKTRLDLIRNEDIRKEAHPKPVETFQKNRILKWFGHCLRRENNTCEIAETRLFLEKEPRSTKKEMDGQHVGRLEERNIKKLKTWHNIENTDD